VPYTRYERLRAELQPLVRVDTHGDPDMGYPVHSVYWDSPGWRFFWEKVEGLWHRRKLRFRRYGRGDGPVFLEIKQRIGRTVQKRRVRWDPERVEALFGGGEPPPVVADGDFADPIAAEILFLIHRFQLRPRMAVSYRRLALFGVFEPDLRITFDRRLQYEVHDTDILRGFDIGRYILDPRFMVMEIKFNDRVPVWLTTLVRRHELEMVRLSKYCSAVDREYHGGVLT